MEQLGRGSVEHGTRRHQIGMAVFGDWLRGAIGKERLQPAAADNNEFALAMYRQLQSRTGNLFFSPFSIRTVLAMAQAGARGESATQMRKALSFSSSDETQHLAFAEMISRLNAPGGQYEMAVANSLWGQEGAALLPEFLEQITQHYAGTMNLVDFRRDAEIARVTMNQWVADKTRKKIGGLIPPGGLDAETRLVLVNAVYFKGTWVQQFLRSATSDEPFYLENGGQVQVPVMRRTEEVRYMHGGGYQAVDLPYRGGDMSMLVLLPDRKDGLRDLEKSLTVRTLDDCVEKMVSREVKLLLPRFKSTWGTVNLREQLDRLGMSIAFTRFKADFSGINGYEPPHEDSLFISDVFHKAIVEVNEEGTEAAATTAVRMPMVAMSLRHRKPPQIPTFRADHPFLFAIRDRRTGAIVFLGRIVDPTRES